MPMRSTKTSWRLNLSIINVQSQATTWLHAKSQIRDLRLPFSPTGQTSRLTTLIRTTNPSAFIWCRLGTGKPFLSLPQLYRSCTENPRVDIDLAAVQLGVIAVKERPRPGNTTNCKEACGPPNHC